MDPVTSPKRTSSKLQQHWRPVPGHVLHLGRSPVVSSANESSTVTNIQAYLGNTARAVDAMGCPSSTSSGCRFSARSLKSRPARYERSPGEAAVVLAQSLILLGLVQLLANESVLGILTWTRAVQDLVQHRCQQQEPLCAARRPGGGRRAGVIPEPDVANREQVLFFPLRPSVVLVIWHVL